MPVPVTTSAAWGVDSDAPDPPVSPSSARARTWGRTWILDVLAAGALIVPFAVVALRYLATTRPVYLSDDLALIDLNVRDATRWQAQLGPFDRFGWNHPGPSVFYLLSIPARLFGSGARAEFVGAIVLNLLAALATLWVVRRRCGPLTALWCSSALAVLALVLTSSSSAATTTSEGPLGALVSPWNPDVVVIPLVLFCVLAAAGASGSWLSLLGAAIVGSFVIQTNLSTFVIVVVFLVGATACAAVRAWRAGHRPLSTDATADAPADDSTDAPADDSTEPDASAPEPADTDGVGRPRRWWPHGRRATALLAALGFAVLVLMWLPPLIQQFTGSPGNLTLIWRFFTKPHHGPSVVHSVWAVLAADAEVPFGLAQEMSSRTLGHPHLDSALALVLVLAVSIGTIVVAVRRRVTFAAVLGVGGLVGLVFSVVSVTRIVGPVYGYLIVWQVAIPVAGLIGLGAALFGTRAEGDERAARHRPVHAALSPPPRSPHLVRTLLVALTLVTGAALTVATVQIPPLEHVSNADVEHAYALVAPRLRPGAGNVFVGDAGTDLRGLFTFFGVFNLLQERGYHPLVSPFWRTEVGPANVTPNPGPVRVVLYPPSARARRMAGYVGSVRHADIVITPAPSR